MNRRNVIVVGACLFAVVLILGAMGPALAADGVTSIVSRVWEDVDVDGIQENEPDVPNVGISLYTCDGTWVADAVTNVSGNAVFSDVPTGSYYLQFDKPAGYSFTLQNAGGNEEFDSDADPGTGRTACFDYVAGSLLKSQDAGIYMEEQPPENPGTGTPGYWMNHPQAWPVGEITIGGMTYSRDEAIALMRAPVRGDKTLSMFPQLVSAKLNVLIGNDDSCVAGVIADADAWLAANPVGSNVRADSEAWDTGEPLHGTLDAYNNGLLCAPSRG